MLLIPAIDIKQGKCVRLCQGDFDDCKIYSDSPVAMAKYWQKEGANNLHIVDLDGAKKGSLVNFNIISDIIKELPDLKVQIGGGIRHLLDIEKYIKAGASYVIIGSKAIGDSAFLKSSCLEYPKNIIVGLDSKDSFVATYGWQKTTSYNIFDIVKQFEDYGVSRIIHTDIAKDGMMQGANFEQTTQLAKNTNIPVIISGGISSMKDIEKLKTCNSNIIGAIIGKALYENKIYLKQALALF